MKSFPIFLTVENKSIVVFGGGADAAAKLRLVQKTDARLFVVAEHVDSSVLTLGQAIWVKTDPETFDLPADMAFAYAATGDADLDRRLAQRVRAQGGLVCAVDQMPVSDFSTPAIVDRDPVVVAIGTEGTAPVLARDIKARIESILEPGLGQVAKVAQGLRAIVNQVTVPGGQRRQFWQAFFRNARALPSQADAIGRHLLDALPTQQSRLSFVTIGASFTDISELPAAARAALHAADVMVVGDDVPSSICELARREAIHLTDTASNRAHIAVALRDQEHVILVRRDPDWGDLVELAAGFGIVPDVYDLSVPAPSTSGVVPFPLSRAA